MTSTDVNGPESAGDPVANEAVGGAAGAAPVPAQKELAEAGPLTTDHSQAELEDESLTVALKRKETESRAHRFRSFEVADFERPNTHVEEWRFTPLRVLSPLFDDVASGDAVSYDVTPPAGVAIGTLAQSEAPRGTALFPEDIVSAIASARTDEALHVKAEKNTVVDEPTVVDITGTDASARSNAHIVVETEESSSATFILHHTGSAQHAENVEIVVGDNSQMTLVTLQEWDDDALHIATHHARLGRDAKLKHIVVTLGGRAVRVNAISEFAAPGSEVEKLGVYFADADQFFEHRLFVDHAAPNCVSNSTYKGALQGDGARSVWVGDVLIRPQATGTNTYELNRNLLLTEGARADSVPNLEIETGEIEGAGHAAATGRFDDEQLFYLKSRGIPEDQARRLVVRGFFAEVINKIGVESVAAKLMEKIEEELDQTMKVEA